MTDTAPTSLQIRSIAVAMSHGKVFQCWRRGEKGLEEMFVVGGQTRLARVPCVCGCSVTRVIYSTDTKIRRPDAYVVIKCEGKKCKRIVDLYCSKETFDSARAAMINACSSAWNRWNAPDTHPDDLASVGGAILDRSAVDKLNKAPDGAEGDSGG